VDSVDSRAIVVLKLVLVFKSVVIFPWFFSGNGLDSEFVACSLIVCLWKLIEINVPAIFVWEWVLNLISS